MQKQYSKIVEEGEKDLNGISNMSEEELRAYLRKVEKNKEELKLQEEKMRREEDEEEQIYAAMVGLERMREYAGEDEKIILLIDEQKSILNTMRLRKMEFADEFKRQLQNNNNRIEEKIIEINQKITEIHMG